MNLYCIARVIEVFASFYVDCNIMKIFPLSVMINSYLVSLLTQSYYLYYQYYWFSVNHTHIAADSLHKIIFSCFCSFTVDYSSYSCYIQSLLIWGGGRGSPGLVCNFLPGWCHPLTTEKQKQGQMYICEGAARRGRAAAHRPVFTAQLHRPARLFLHCSRTHIRFICFTIVKTLRRGWTHL